MLTHGVISSYSLTHLLICTLYVNYSSKLKHSKAATATSLLNGKRVREKSVIPSSLSGEKLFIKFLVPQAKTLNQPVTRASQGFSAGLSGLTHLPRTSPGALPQNLKDIWMECPFSALLPVPLPLFTQCLAPFLRK